MTIHLYGRLSFFLSFFPTLLKSLTRKHDISTIQFGTIILHVHQLNVGELTKQDGLDHFHLDGMG